MAASQRREYLEREREKRGPLEQGQKITSRRQLRGGFRFLSDTGEMIIHDLAGEKDTCDLEELFERGEATVHIRPLSDAESAGFKTCSRCIGDSAEKTFNGTTTALFVMHLPRNRSTTQLDGVLERENFTGRLLSGVKNNHADELRLLEVMRQHKVETVFIQARRARAADLDPKRWGEPEIVSSLNPDLTASMSPANDVLTDIFTPISVMGDEAGSNGKVRTLVEDLLSVETIRNEIAGHGRRYGYRDLACYYHVVDSVDDWVVHRPHPKCTSCSGGATTTTTILANGSRSSDTYYYGEVTVRY